MIDRTRNSFLLPLLLVPFLLQGTFIPSTSGETDSSTSSSGKKEKTKQKEKEKQTRTSVSKHTVTVEDEQVTYTATAGTLPIASGEDDPAARFFYVAYERSSDDQSGNRPILFSFNGGPGSSSVWLHLGLLGPRHIDFPPAPEHSQPPYRLSDHTLSLIDRTDMVFIDPVSTGYSRAVEGVDEKKFHGLKQDISSVGKFIYQYLDRNARWNAPKFIIGESYGTTRAAGLANHLSKRYGMDLNGLLLVSPILNYDRRKTVLAHILRLPTYTASAHYHDRLPEKTQNRSLSDLLSDVESFSIEEYAPALHRGNTLGKERRRRILTRLSNYTGLSKSFIDTNNLRVPMARFSKQLLREKSKIIGRFDTRYTGFARDPGNDRYEYDPSFAVFKGPFSETMYQYLRTELGYESKKVYEILGNVHPWDYNTDRGTGSVNLAPDLREAMLKNPHMNVLVAAGLYDLATPYFAARHTFNHLNLPDAYSGNVTFHTYQAGHMMYVHDPSRKKMRSDLIQFLNRSIPENK